MLNRRTARVDTVQEVLVPAALMVSGLIHLILTPEHLVASPPLGAGFAAVALLQLGLGILLLVKPSRYVRASSLVILVFSLAVYATVHAADLPLAHGHAGRPMLIELICKGAEVVGVGGLVLSKGREGHAARHGTRRPVTMAALIMTGVLTAVIASYAGSSLIPHDNHEHPHEQTHEHAASS